MDVDHPLAPRIDEPGREHEHVAGEHDDVGPFRLQERPQGARLRVAVAVAHGQGVERQSETRDEIAVRFVVRRDERDLAGDLAEVEAHEEVSETVTLPRRE